MGEEAKSATEAIRPTRLAWLIGQDAPCLRMVLTVAIVTASIVLALFTS